MNFPDFTTADIQVSVQYLVYGLRKEFKAAGRKVAVFGISQGGLLPRFALTYWPDLRRKVGDVLAAAGAQHGTTVGRGCSDTSPCAPADWQQGRHSNLLDAINAQPDETPGDVSYTTVRSLSDETVQPQGGKHPTSALEGARNILIQDVCPGRTTTHIGTAVDSVSFAAFVDAIERNRKGKQGAANVSRLPSDVCDHPYATGLDEAQTSAFLSASRWSDRDAAGSGPEGCRRTEGAEDLQTTRTLARPNRAGVPLCCSDRLRHESERDRLMPARWLVDGMNLIGSRPDGWWADRARAMRELVSELERFVAEGGTR